MMMLLSSYVPKDRAPITRIEVKKSNISEKVEKWLRLRLKLNMEKNEILYLASRVSWRNQTGKAKQGAREE